MFVSYRGRGENAAGKRVEISLDAKSIGTASKALKWSGQARRKLSTPPPIEFARECLTRKSSVVSTKLLGTTILPELTAESIETDKLTKLQREFAENMIVGIRVQSALPRLDGTTLVGEAYVFAQRTSSTERFESYYVREGMTITKLSTKQQVKGVHGLVLVEQGALASLLGDTEGPSHTTWDTSNDERPKRVWKAWKGRVTFFCKILDNVIQLLTPTSTQADFSITSEFFSIEQKGTLRAASKKRVPSDDDTANVYERIPHTPRWYRLDGEPKIFVENATSRDHFFQQFLKSTNLSLLPKISGTGICGY